jgi:hypothetical protein
MLAVETGHFYPPGLSADGDQLNRPLTWTTPTSSTTPSTS